jgi:hypothetical protein
MLVIARAMIRNKPDSYCYSRDVATEDRLRVGRTRVAPRTAPERRTRAAQSPTMIRTMLAGARMVSARIHRSLSATRRWPVAPPNSSPRR